MTPDQSNRISCGAENCTLNHGQTVWDAGMEFIRCPTCQVLRSPDAKIVHQSVLPDPRGSLSLVMRILFHMRMVWLRATIPLLRNKSVSIIDAGCGDGQFLEFLKGLGYRNTAGIEPELHRRENALARGVRVLPELSGLKNADEARICADVIIFWHVIEHIPLPVPVIQQYAASTAPGGVMLISVPNHQSWQTRLFGFYSAYPDYGRHLWFHSASYVKWIHSQLPGFQVSLLPDFNFEYEIFSWVDSIISFVVRRQNFAHRILKKGEGRTFARMEWLLQPFFCCRLRFRFPA